MKKIITVLCAVVLLSMGFSILSAQVYGDGTVTMPSFTIPSHTSETTTESTTETTTESATESSSSESSSSETSSSESSSSASSEDSTLPTGGTDYDVTDIPFGNKIADCTVSGIQDAIYTGNPIGQFPVLTYDNQTLKRGTDYTLTYKNNRQIGTATVIISGKGDYVGQTKVHFSINPWPTTLCGVTSVSAKTMEVQWQPLTEQVTGYQLEYSADAAFENSKTVTVRGAYKSTATVGKLRPGTQYYVRIRTYKNQGADAYYSAWSDAVTVTVAQ